MLDTSSFKSKRKATFKDLSLSNEWKLTPVDVHWLSYLSLTFRNKDYRLYIWLWLRKGSPKKYLTLLEEGNNEQTRWSQWAYVLSHRSYVDCLFSPGRCVWVLPDSFHLCTLTAHQCSDLSRRPFGFISQQENT